MAQGITEETPLPQVQPFDEHNRKLVDNVHPPDWVNPEPTGRYNLVVIGAGTAGLVTAAGAAGLGAKVALIERELLGGDCLNVGCVPSKALIRCARAFADMREAGRFGVQVPSPPTHLGRGDSPGANSRNGVWVDFPAVMERMRRLRTSISSHDSARRFRDLGIDVFLGDARFTGRDTVAVAGKTLRFSKACLATGARPVTPPIPGLAEAGCLTNQTLFSLTELPQRLAVVGGGPIGCEMAQTFARFGSQVSLIEMAGHVLIREDADAAEIIQNALKRDGVQLVLNTKLSEVKDGPDGKVLLIESTDGTKRELAVDEILIGVGRAPNVEGLDLETAGVEYDRSGVRVNDRLQTTNPRIYAAGDICFPYKFTHTADALARIVIQNALFFGRAKSSTLTIPWCTYTNPEIAHVGMSARQAEQRGMAVDTITVPLNEVDRAVLDGEDAGFLKLHLKRRTDAILGATLVARHAGEMISEITLAMVSRVGLRTIAKTIHPYPTQAEVIKKAADAYNRSRLTPRLKRAFRLLMRWRR